MQRAPAERSPAWSPPWTRPTPSTANRYADCPPPPGNWPRIRAPRRTGAAADDDTFIALTHANGVRSRGPSRPGLWCVGTRTREWLVRVHQGKTATGDDARRGAGGKCGRRVNLTRSPCLAVSGVINRWRHFFTGSDGGASGGAGS
ncbi:hypothetical protein FE633_29365 [Streptomyces montanus]|uniref:Uncharacterized protein n=1 Tax=Streptomyces montanus TaxID=2580423 RepID=A0A5R9FG38_9ACTN|nr:hypothetical protein FE633_29365 [Streptomyces montanus]